MHLHSYRTAVSVFLNSSGKVPLALHAAWLLASFVCLPGCATVSYSKNAGPWNVTALSKTPPVSWGAIDGFVQELYYDGEPMTGKPTRVFAYLGRPTTQSMQRLPAMVLVHG